MVDLESWPEIVRSVLKIDLRGEGNDAIGALSSLPVLKH